MFNLPGFLVAQAIPFGCLAAWGVADFLAKKLPRKKPKALPATQPDVSHKWVMPSIKYVYGRVTTRRVQYERIPLTKRERWVILKRDNFTCQYCGRKPPAVTLEVDHMQSVRGGGNNAPGNLITSCLDCNRGKGADSLH